MVCSAVLMSGAGGCRTTTELTTKLSLGIARMLGLEHVEGVVELVVRGVSHASIYAFEDGVSSICWGCLGLVRLT